MLGKYFAIAEGRQFGYIVQFGKVAGTSRQAEGVEGLQINVFLNVYHDDLEWLAMVLLCFSSSHTSRTAAAARETISAAQKP